MLKVILPAVPVGGHDRDKIVAVINRIENAGHNIAAAVHAYEADNAVTNPAPAATGPAVTGTGTDHPAPVGDHVPAPAPATGNVTTTVTQPGDTSYHP